MTDIKHTKGEWYQEINKLKELDQESLIIRTKEGRVMCSVSTSVDISEEDYANAKLISAAPELLEALVMFREFALTSVIPSRKDTIELKEKVEAAIKKATS